MKDPNWETRKVVFKFDCCTVAHSESSMDVLWPFTFEKHADERGRPLRSRPSRVALSAFHLLVEIPLNWEAASRTPTALADAAMAVYNRNTSVPEMDKEEMAFLNTIFKREYYRRRDGGGWDVRDHFARQLHAYLKTWKS